MNKDDLSIDYFTKHIYTITNIMFNGLNKNIKKTNLSEHSRWTMIENSMDYIQTKIKIITFCDIYFNEVNETEPIKEKWVGFIHNPIGYEKYWSNNNFLPLLNNQLFLNSLSNCKMLITMSSSCKDYFILKINNELGFHNIIIKNIYHPIPNNMYFNFDFSEFKNNRQILFVGNWLRKTYSIFKLNCNLSYKKAIIPFTERTKLELNYYCEKDGISINDTEYNSVYKYEKKNQKEFEKIFTSSVILLNVYLTTINNTLLECIASNTPILLNRHQEFVDILGADYPLFFDNMEDINSLLNDELILNAHHYLKNMDKTSLTLEYFINTFKNYISCINS